MSWLKINSAQTMELNATGNEDNDSISDNSNVGDSNNENDSDNEEEDESCTEYTADSGDDDDKEHDSDYVITTIDDIEKYVTKCVTRKQTFQQTPITHRKKSGSSFLESVTVIREECPVTHEKHWFYYTCGFSDIFDSVARNEEDQGDDILSFSGFELCLRLKRCEVLEKCLGGIQNIKNENLLAPDWPIELFKMLICYILEEHTFFEDGDWMPGTLTSNYILAYQQKVKQIIEERMKESDTDAPSLLEALEYCDKQVLLNSYLFRIDPVLNKVFTRTGNVQFLQIVPITDDELNQACSWVTCKLMNLMSERCGLDVRDKNGENKNPLLVCDIYRGSCLEDEAILQECRNDLLLNGSQSSILCANATFEITEADECIVTIPIAHLRDLLQPIICFRIPYYRQITCINGYQPLIHIYPLEELDVSIRSDGTKNEERGSIPTEEQKTNQQSGKSFFIHQSESTTLLLKCSNEFAQILATTEFSAEQDYQWPDYFPRLLLRVT
jgi:hypothetical protein